MTAGNHIESHTQTFEPGVKLILSWMLIGEPLSALADMCARKSRPSLWTTSDPNRVLRSIPRSDFEADTRHGCAAGYRIGTSTRRSTDIFRAGREFGILPQGVSFMGLFPKPFLRRIAKLRGQRISCRPESKCWAELHAFATWGKRGVARTGRAGPNGATSR
jgi:hypothetical protein